MTQIRRPSTSTREWITKDQFQVLTRPLLELPVSRTWRGYGSAIFLEVGELTESSTRRRDGSVKTTSCGQFSVMIEWSWRVEKAKSVSFGSFSSDRKITNCLAKLQNLTVVDVAVEGRLPELVVQLEGGVWVHSFTTVESQLEWCLFFNEGADARRWIDSHNGKLRLTTAASNQEPPH